MVDGNNELSILRKYRKLFESKKLEWDKLEEELMIDAAASGQVPAAVAQVACSIYSIKMAQKSSRTIKWLNWILVFLTAAILGLTYRITQM